MLPASEEELIDIIDAADGKRSPAAADLAGQDFAAIVIDYLKAEGVKQQDKGDRISFESLTPWPGNFVGASGTFIEGENGAERRAAILIGPEYGTVGRQDLVAAAREAVDARFDVLIACAFNFDAHSSELGSLGSLKILKARIETEARRVGPYVNLRGSLRIRMEAGRAQIRRSPILAKRGWSID